MSVRDLPAEELIELALEAISEHSPGRLSPLIDPGVRVVTERGTHEGADAVLAWAAKGYENLNRRFALDALAPVGAGLLGSGRVEYVWRDTGEVGDASPVFLALRLSDEGLLAGLSLFEERAAAVADLRG